MQPVIRLGNDLHKLMDDTSMTHTPVGIVTAGIVTAACLWTEGASVATLIVGFVLNVTTLG